MKNEFMGEYAKEWGDIAEAVKVASDYRCARCGHPDNPSTCAALGVRRGQLPCDDKCTHEQDGKQRVLTIHHLDGDKSNNRWWNLVPLCQKCHLYIQGKVILKRTWMLEHSDWFKPYVGGYYAYLRGLPDDQAFVEKNLDNLLDYTLIDVPPVSWYPYYWYSRTRHGDEFLEPCRIIIKQKDSRKALVEFADGTQTVTFISMLRKRRDENEHK